MKLRLLLIIMACLLAGCEKGDGEPCNKVDPEWRPAASKPDEVPVVTSNAGVATEEVTVTEPANQVAANDVVANEVVPDGVAANEAGSINQRIHQAAVNSVDNLDSSGGPGGGNLACAWAVNRILRSTIGRTFDHNGTSSMDAELRMGVSSGTVERIDRENVRPGDIVISPTVGDRIGHVGIMGENGMIYSNSSRLKQWKQNYNLSSWTDRYTGRNLAVNFYRVTSAPTTTDA